VAIICLGALLIGLKADANNQHNHLVDSEVTVNAFYKNDQLIIELFDLNEQVPELELSHEKQMHVIVVSSDLKQFYHVHPENIEEGIYTQQLNLSDNIYNVFVDIKPKGLNYEIAPIQIHVGNTDVTNSAAKLSSDTNFTKTVNGHAIRLKLESPIKAHEEIMLDFEMLGGKPEPYLGALGHVVILDEDGDSFVHVHPMSADKTLFHTQFDKPGKYKIWAEFKFNDQVNVYPFVVNVVQ